MNQIFADRAWFARDYPQILLNQQQCMHDKMGNLFGIKKAVTGISEKSQELLTTISKEVTETRILLTEITNKTLQRIDEELTEARVFLTEKAWPEVNKTMAQFRDVMDQTDEFLVTSTFAVKALALLIALCAVYMTHRIISERKYVQRWQSRGKVNTSSFTMIVDAFLNIMLCLCIALAFVLLLQLLKIKKIINTLWLYCIEMFPNWEFHTKLISDTVCSYTPRSILLVIIIPSLTTLVVLFRHLVAILKATCTLLMHILIVYPFNRFLDPVIRGLGYLKTLPFLQILNWTILYVPILYSGAWILFLLQSEKSILTCNSILIMYMYAYASALLISILYTHITSPVIRYIWAYRARRNLEQKNQ